MHLSRSTVVDGFQGSDQLWVGAVSLREKAAE